MLEELVADVSQEDLQIVCHALAQVHNILLYSIDARKSFKYYSTLHVCVQGADGNQSMIHFFTHEAQTNSHQRISQCVGPVHFSDGLITR